MNKKIIPGFGRYNMLENGFIERRATAAIIQPGKNGKTLLVDDTGKKAAYNHIEGYKELFPDQKKKKLIKKVELPSDPAELLKMKRPHKLTTEQVIEMRSEFAAGNFKPKHAPERYGICAQTAGKIIHRILYPDL